METSSGIPSLSWRTECYLVGFFRGRTNWSGISLLMAFTLSNQATTWLSDRRWKPLETNQNPLSNLLGTCGKWFGSSRSLTIKSFWWRVCKNSLATKENLSKSKCSPSSSCPVCDSQLETVEHLLFFCSWAIAVWFGCKQILNESGYPCSAIKWTSEICESLPASEACEFLSSVAFTAWFIWKGRRNDVIFRHAKVDRMEVVAKIRCAKVKVNWLSFLEIRKGSW